MATIPAPLADLQGLTLDQIAQLDTEEILRRIVPQAPAVPVAAFQSAI